MKGDDARRLLMGGDSRSLIKVTALLCLRWTGNVVCACSTLFPVFVHALNKAGTGDRAIKPWLGVDEG